MTSPEQITVRSPEDILGFIPHSLGYWPAASLVAMTLQGKRLGATLRLDLPVGDSLSDPVAFAHAVRGYLRADLQADGTLLAVFTSKRRRATPGGYDLLLAGLQSVLAEAGMPVRSAWYVGEDYWRDAYCSDPACCPLPGRPVQEIRDSMLSAEMVFRGSSIGPAPGERPAPARPVPSLYQAAVAEEETAWSAQLEGGRQSRAQFEAVLDVWTALLSSPTGATPAPTAERDGFLRASLLVPAWRDSVLVMAAAGREAASAGAELFGIFEDGCAHQPVGPSTGLIVTASAEATAWAACPLPQGPDAAGLGGLPGYGDVLMGLEPERPHWGRLDLLDLVLEQLAASGGQAAAAALTGRGWIAWCRGRGSYSAAYLGQALDIEPGYRLAELLLEMVRRGTLCGWAARKDAAWQTFGPDAA